MNNVKHFSTNNSGRTMLVKLFKIFLKYWLAISSNNNFNTISS